MKHGEKTQEDILHAEFDSSHTLFCINQEVFVGEHDSFGKTGGARGIKKNGQIIFFGYRGFLKGSR